jgi:GntR family transcriptional regulator
LCLPSPFLLLRRCLHVTRGSSDLRHDITFAGRAPAPAHVAEAFGIEPGEEVVVRRRTLSDKDTGRPEELGASYLPMPIAGGTYLEKPAVVPKALFLCVEELAGKPYAHAHDQWTARMPSAEEAAALDLPTGAPVIHIVHIARADDGTALEVSESVWPAERVVVIDDYPSSRTPTSPRHHQRCSRPRRDRRQWPTTEPRHLTQASRRSATTGGGVPAGA